MNKWAIFVGVFSKMFDLSKSSKCTRRVISESESDKFGYILAQLLACLYNDEFEILSFYNISFSSV